MVVNPAKTVVRWGVNHALPRAVLQREARKGDLQGRMVFESLSGADLIPLFDEIRAAGPLATTGFSRITTRHEVVREVLTSPDFRVGIFVPDDSLIGRLGSWSSSQMLHPVEPPSLLAVDPPDHTRYRKLVTRVFTVKAVEQLRARTEEVAHAILDGLDPSSPVDLISTYCAELPVTIISEILGVEPEDRGRVLSFGSAAAPSLDLGLSWRTFRQVENALRDFDGWLGGHLERLRREPGDNLLSQLVAAKEDGVGLTERELKATAGLVLAAGFETTVNLLGNGIALLTEHPDQLALLRERDDLWMNAVDETLRYDPPVLLTGRMAARDTEVAGMQVPKGSLVSTVLAGANRDPDVFDDPHVYDVGRANARDHLAFSAGRHYCLGASLARMEGEVGLRAIFDRFPDLRLLPGAERRTTRILRGFERLPAVLAG